MKSENIVKLLDILEGHDDYDCRVFNAKELLKDLDEDINCYDIDDEEEYRALVNELSDSCLDIELLEQKGGEDEGSEYYVIFKVGDRFFKNETTYASYAGISDWWGTKEVKPTTKEIIVYE